MTIMLIEPDRVLGPVIMAALEARQYQVKWRQSAQAALDALDETVPDIIVLELQLGIHNGIEFLYELRTYPEWQNIPVIIHTLNSQAIDSRFGAPLSQLGVKQILYKPRTSLKQLVRAVGQLVEV